MVKLLLRWGIVTVILATGCNAPRPAERGAYDVVRHYSVPCSGHGGFGEYVIVRSHRQADLEPTLRRWYATNHHDNSRCLYLFAFSSVKSKDAFEHDIFGRQTAYSPNDRGTAAPGLFYYNNPNSRTEGWIAPGGSPHKGGPTGG